MIALFVALGITVLTLLALLLWFVPHLLQQQALRSADESAQLREMLLDMLSEQEAVTIRQSQLSTSISYLQDQLEQIVAVNTHSHNGANGEAALSPDTLKHIEERVSIVQGQLQDWLEHRSTVMHSRTTQDNESWGYLLSLLSNIQDRVGSLSTERSNVSVGLHASALLEELEHEMKHLHTISEDIATLQWRLRRSLHERETNISALRSQTPSAIN